MAADGTEALAPGRIVQLEETVINRIAAGEVVVRPANALKELIENSIDAGSRHVAVFVKNGGMKMLRVEDDGHGIRHEDMPILCERFTTSKLRNYEDLTAIGTFGFRGEALASMTHVGHVTVTTMTREDETAWVAQYTDGKPRAPAKPCAGNRGTTIVIEDLFYNNSTRRQALGKDSVEHARILEVLQKYAVHYPKLSFSCRKAGSGMAELHTQGGDDVRAEDAIGVVYGQALARELFAFAEKSEDPKFELRGYASGPNFSRRNCSLILFINHRLVECAPLRRAVEAAYQPVLPRHQHPWVYLELEVDASTIDVNVHPTKNEVQFLHEESIAQLLQETLTAQLRERAGSRTFNGAALVPARATGLFESAPEAAVGLAEGAARPAAQQAPKPTRIRTDHGQRSLDSVLRGQPAQQVPLIEGAAASHVFPRLGGSGGEEVAAASDKRRVAYEEAQLLTSIGELRQCAVVADGELTDSLRRSVYVGPVTRELVLIQCGASLCLAHLGRIARECAYQRLLRRFGGVGSVVLSEPLPLLGLLRLGILDPGSGYDERAHPAVDIDALAAKFAKLLEEKAEMLAEYLSFDIDGGLLKALPNALGVSSGNELRFDGLPLFLVRLCSTTDWTEEKACFEDLCRTCADFFVDAMLSDAEDAKEVACSSRVAAADDLNAAVEAGDFEDVASAAAAASKRARVGGAPHVLECLRWLHEAVRKDGACQWPVEYTRDGTVVELASLNQLYRIFERC